MAEAKELVQKRLARGGHRGRITKILPTVQGLTENFQEENRQEVKKFYFELKEKLETLHKLDKQILDLVSETAKEDAKKKSRRQANINKICLKLLLRAKKF